MDLKKLAKTILCDIGGRENVVSMSHCATRLRFNLNDNGAADSGHLKKTRGVMGVLSSCGQYQVVVGNKAKEVYKELSGMLEQHAGISKSQRHKRSFLAFFMDSLWKIIAPSLPVVAGVCAIKLIQIILVRASVIEINSYISNFISAITNAVIYLLPFLLAYSIARVFNLSATALIITVGVICYPELLALIIPNYRRNDVFYITAGVLIAVSLLLQIRKQRADNARFEKSDNIKNDAIVYAPIKGRIVALDEIKNNLPAENGFLKGAVIIPETNLVVAPDNCLIESISYAGNSVSVITETKAELLIYVETGTEESADNFTFFAEENDCLKMGEPIFEFDLNAIKIASGEIYVYVIVLNGDATGDVEIIAENAIEQKPFFKIISEKGNE